MNVQRRYWVWGGLSVIILYLLFCLWPVRGFFTPRFLFGKTLVIFTNEAEARPCGGFVSAFGEVRGVWPHFKLTNVYALADHPLGPAPAPLDRIAKDQFFWDLGTEADLSACSEAFETAYEKITDQNIAQTLLVDLALLEDVLSIVGPVRLEDQIFTDQNVFAQLTRAVANVDRHNEEALAERKVSMAKLGKKIFWKALFSPHRWPVLTRHLQQKTLQGSVYESNISGSYGPKSTDFSLTEWNLGGAKSSRYLDKTLRLTLREESPESWKLRAQLEVRHQGGFSEPLSQAWKGVFAVKFPDALSEQPTFVEATLQPGEMLTREWDYSFQGDFRFLSFFRPRGQQYRTDVGITLFPQKTFQEANFNTRENVGTFDDRWNGQDRLNLHWEVAPDTLPPFITLHEIITSESVSPDIQQELLAFAHEDPTLQPMVIEVHLNEASRLTPKFAATLKDLQHSVPVIDETPIHSGVKLLDDQRTLLLVFWQREYQPEERFSLELAGLEDLFGNEIISVPRTVIDRR